MLERADDCVRIGCKADARGGVGNHSASRALASVARPMARLWLARELAA